MRVKVEQQGDTATSEDTNFTAAVDNRPRL